MAQLCGGHGVTKRFEVSTDTATGAWRIIVTGQRDQAEQTIFNEFVTALTERTIGGAASGAVVNRAYWRMTGQWRSGDPFPTKTLIPERPVSLAVLTFIFCVLMGSILIHAPDRRTRFRYTISFGLLLAGGCGYLLVLLVAYLFSYGNSIQGLEVRYFERYVGTYVVATGLVIIGCIVSNLHAPGMKNFVRVTLILCLVGAASVASRMSVSILGGITPEHIETRKHIRSLVDYADRRIRPEARIYVVWQNTTGTNTESFITTSIRTL